MIVSIGFTAVTMTTLKKTTYSDLRFVHVDGEVGDDNLVGNLRGRGRLDKSDIGWSNARTRSHRWCRAN